MIGNQRNWRRVVLFSVSLLLLLPSVSHAEFCWMTGCRNAVGYVPVAVTKDGKNVAMFSTKEKVKVGSTATMAEYVYLRPDPIDDPQGPFLLSPGTTVKILDYVKTSQLFAVVRVLKERNTRQEECPSKIRCEATIY
jgi:hypothetical protein